MSIISSIGPTYSQLPTPNSQLPTTNYQPPTTNHQPPTTNHQLPTTNCSQIRLLNEIVGAPLVARSIGEDAPLVQHGDAVGKRECHVHVVLDEHHGDRRIELRGQIASRAAL